MERNKYTFDEFEEIGYNAEWDTWGVHGVNVYEDGHFIGEIPWVSVEEVEGMDDSELAELFNKYGIIY